MYLVLASSVKNYADTIGKPKGLYVNVSSAVAPRYAPLRHTQNAGLRGHHIAPRGPMSLGRDDTAFQHALQGVTNRATHLEIDAKLFGT